MNALRQLLPRWIKAYPRAQFTGDLLAGLIVTLLVIPQSLAYALLAGLPPQAGLYVSIFPVIAYALLGSSMTQAVGPVAITAIMTFTVLSPLETPGSPHYIALAASLSLLSGALILAFGLFRLGFLSQLLSRPVISGFISGSAVLIVISQFKLLLGVNVSGATTWQILYSLYENVSQARPITMLTSGVALLVLYTSRLWMPKALGRIGLSMQRAVILVRLMPLLVVVAATLMVVEFDLDRTQGLAVVGSVQEGLASFTFFLPSLVSLKLLTVPAMILALIGMVQNITMAQALAIKQRERVDANRELVGLGAANIVAAFYGGMPVGGGLSRSAINVASGARSPLASIVSAMVMLCIVAAGTHWFARLPLAVLAASIVIAAIGLIDVKAFRQAWSYDRADALALLGTGLGVLVLGLELGIALGIGLSLATLLLRASSPHIAVIGRIAGTEHFRNVERHGVETIPGVLFLRIDESLFFGNLNAVESRLGVELEKAADLRDVVLIMSGVNRVDTTAMEVLSDINRDLASRNIRLHLAEVKGPVQDRLICSPLWKALSGDVHLSANRAFEALRPLASVPVPEPPDWII
ncbi:MAG: sulfate permease [Propionivibrio sp.]|uniref:SulP family inorganic anion transporter n=1 Tax=Propionivibrio sp. TaxID=2212460 RepID=UPI001A3ECEBC|nr:sulfate permease [Propionivibrio sp.]MBL8416443.1 sulfate permease [Propionivibrio sp.]